MRRAGRVKIIPDSSGGGGKLGVDGTGSGLDVGGARRRGMRRGSLEERSDEFTDGFDTASSSGGTCAEDGILDSGRTSGMRFPPTDSTKKRSVCLFPWSKLRA